MQGKRTTSTAEAAATTNLVSATQHARKSAEAAGTDEGKKKSDKDFKVSWYQARKSQLDPEDRRHLWFLPAVLGVVGISLVDLPTCYLAAETLGKDPLTTLVFAVIFVATLAGFGWLGAYFHHDGDSKGSRGVLVVAFVLIMVISALRYLFLLETTTTLAIVAFLQVLLLAGVSTFVVLGTFVVLSRTEPVKLWWEARRPANKAVTAYDEAVTVQTRALGQQRHQADVLERWWYGRPDGLTTLEEHVQREIEAAKDLP